MTIDPARQAALFAASLAAGLLLGLFIDALAMLRALFGLATPPEALKRYYLFPLPLIGKPVGLIHELRWHRALRALLDALEALLLPAFAVVALVLVTFVYNDGALRPLSLLLFLLGLFLWKTTVSERLLIPLAWLSLALAVAARYLIFVFLLPIRLLAHVLCRFILLPLWHLGARCLYRVQLMRTAGLCRRELAAAAQGFGIMK